MATTRVRPQLVAFLLVTPLLAAACWAQMNGQVGTSEPPTTVPGSTATASARLSASAPKSPDLLLQCPYTLPPSRGPIPVPGISIRSANRAQIEIANATGRTYYFRVAAWVVLELDCGRGLVNYEVALGPIAAGEKALVGVTEDVPITVEVWDRPCGEGCVRPPLGIVVVPMSSLEPPAPLMT